MLDPALYDLRDRLIRARTEDSVEALLALYAEIVRCLGRPPTATMADADGQIVGTCVVSFFARELTALSIDPSPHLVEAIGHVTGLVIEILRRITSP